MPPDKSEPTRWTLYLCPCQASTTPCYQHRYRTTEVEVVAVDALLSDEARAGAADVLAAPVGPVAMSWCARYGAAIKAAIEHASTGEGTDG